MNCPIHLVGKRFDLRWNPVKIGRVHVSLIALIATSNGKRLTGHVVLIFIYILVMARLA